MTRSWINMIWKMDGCIFALNQIDYYLIKAIVLSGFAGFKDTGAGSVQSTDVYLLINTQRATQQSRAD